MDGTEPNEREHWNTAVNEVYHLCDSLVSSHFKSF